MAVKTYSTIPFIADALKLAFATRPKLADTLVVDGVPTPGEYDADELVILLDVTFEQRPKAMNVTTRPREERYTQNVIISALKESETNATASVRAWALFAEIEAAIRDNPTLAGHWTANGQIVSVQVGAGRFAKRGSGEQRESAIDFGILVHARI